MNIVPLFKSHYSIGKSILTLSKYDSSSEDEPSSIIDICKKNNVKDFFLLEDNFSSFKEAYENSQEADLNLRYGVRINFCEDVERKDKDEAANDSKICFFAKNTQGVKDLMKLYSLSATTNFFLNPRIDLDTMKKLDLSNILVCFPFYDNFLFQNSFHNSKAIFNLNNVDHFFFVEKNGLPFDDLNEKIILNFTKGKDNIIRSKTIYYENRKDFISYLTFRNIQNRSTFQKPNLDHFSSNEFCFQSWKEQNGL